jgi:AraC-like DNA-binding protein
MDEAAPRKRGRPPIDVTPELRREVYVRISCGMPLAAVAKVMRMNERTLRRHFGEELEGARLETIVTQASQVYSRGLRDDAVGQRASEFWLKCVGGWKETVKIEETPQTLIVQIRGDDTVVL